jgi:TonB family protein
MAQKTRRSGSVLLRVLVDDHGGASTVSVSASSGSPELDRAARIGARNAALCLRDGKTRAEAGYAQMQVNFKMSPLLVGR